MGLTSGFGKRPGVTPPLWPSAAAATSGRIFNATRVDDSRPMNQFGGIPGPGGGGSSWAYRRRRTGAILVGVAVGVSILAAAYSSWMCTGVVYNCPANGCGNVPAQNCERGVTVLLATGTGGVILASIGAVLLLATASKRGTPQFAARGGRL